MSDFKLFHQINKSSSISHSSFFSISMTLLFSCDYIALPVLYYNHFHLTSACIIIMCHKLTVGSCKIKAVEKLKLEKY